jgi:hypothetical protein
LREPLSMIRMNLRSERVPPLIALPLDRQPISA